MARFHRYAESNPKKGYYLYHKYQNQNITYQVSDFAENILLTHGYEDGDRLDRDVFYALLELDLIYTHNSGTTPTPDDTSTYGEGEDTTLESEERKKLLEQLLEHTEITEEKAKELREYIKSEFGEEASRGKTKISERDKRYEKYWRLIGITRYLKKITEQADIPIEREVGISSLVDEYISVLKRKNTMRQRRRIEDWPMTLPKYIEKFETPGWDYREISRDRASYFGLSTDSFGQDEDPIYLDEEYKVPMSESDES